MSNKKFHYLLFVLCVTLRFVSVNTSDITVCDATEIEIDGDKPMNDKWGTGWVNTNHFPLFLITRLDAIPLLGLLLLLQRAVLLSYCG